MYAHAHTHTHIYIYIYIYMRLAFHTHLALCVPRPMHTGEKDDCAHVTLLYKHYSPLCEGPNAHTSHEIHLFDDMVPQTHPSCWLNIKSITPEYEGSNVLPFTNTGLC
jgi:hypothetical protein